MLTSEFLYDRTGRYFNSIFCSEISNSYFLDTKIPPLPSLIQQLPAISISQENIISCDVYNTTIFACANGYLPMIEWLYEYRAKSFTKKAMTAAIMNGHLNIIKFLDSKNIGYGQNAFDQAAIYNHLDIAKFLYENVQEISPDIAMEYAAENGNLEFVKWLYEEDIVNYTDETMDCAVRNNHLEIVRFLHEEVEIPCTDDMLEIAIRRNYEVDYGDLIEYLHPLASKYSMSMEWD